MSDGERKSIGGLSHLDEGGRARMVDVGDKPVTRRVAVAEGRLRLSARAFEALDEQRLAKGDALAVARIAGIQAAKRTSDWIPLCHPVPLDSVEIVFEPDARSHEVRVVATTRTQGRTGVEMEALVAAGAACLTLYDMTKGVDRGAEIVGIRLLAKSGGRSGDWEREEERR